MHSNNSSETNATRASLLASNPDIASEAKPLVAWVEAQTGGKVTSCVPQGRWRPAWFLEVATPTGLQKLYARGDRPPDLGVSYTLEYEIRVHNLLVSQGIPVPAALGLCPEPRYMVMQQVGGRANLGTASSEAERLSVMSDYITALVKVHQIPLSVLAAAGFDIPSSREAIALGNFSVCERLYLDTKLRPDPLVEFGRRWVRRNLPAIDRPATFTVYDSGQFHFDQGRLVALLDLELAHVGDPIADIAALAMRDTVEPLGDLAPICELYERLTGSVLDARLVAYHRVKWAMITPLNTHVALNKPTPDTDLMTYLTWYVDNARWAMEGMAELMGITLEPIDIPASRSGPRQVVFDHITHLLDREQPRDKVDKSTKRQIHRLHRLLRRSDEVGAAFAAADLAETAALLGSQPANLDEADAQLERFVQAAGPEHDADLIRLFDRRLQRLHATFGAPGSRVVAHPAIQKLGRQAV